MKFNTDYRIENYILNTSWTDHPKDVRERTVCCAIDLFGALILGSKGKQYQTGVRVASRIGARGTIPVLGYPEKYNLLGASVVFSHAANSFDIDDGYNMVKGHPGASFIGGVLSAALERDCSYCEFLTTLAVCYETAIRWGLAEQEHYGFLHSTGTYGAFGTAAGVGRLRGLDQEQLNNALSMADFHAPLTPVMRSVEYPSMNKDGVAFGSLIGTMAVIETEEGETARTHLLELPEFSAYLDSLRTRYYIRELYFKPYTCCRWAHQPISACIALMERYGIAAERIRKVTVHTFHAATRLSKKRPDNTDEAQYNIAFPIAAAIIHGDVGFRQVCDAAVTDKEVLSMMEKLDFVVDPDLEERFPEIRQAWVEMELDDNRIIRSPVCDAPGEQNDPELSMDWITDKFRRVTAPFLTGKEQDSILEELMNVGETRVRKIISDINRYL